VRTIAIAASLAALGLLVGCAPVPPPDVLREVARLRDAPAVVTSTVDAPAARARADVLVAEAERAFAAGDPTASQLVGEEARAAYALLLAEARAVRALDRRVRAEAESVAAAAELVNLRAANQRVSADADRLAGRLEALDASARSEAGARPGARTSELELERFDAQLVCMAAELAVERRAAGPDGPALRDAMTRARGDLDAALREGEALGRDRLAPIAEACLRVLTDARSRAGAASSVEPRLDEALAKRGLDVVTTPVGVLVRLPVVEPRREPDDRVTVETLAAVGAARGLPMVVLGRCSAKGKAAQPVARRAKAVADGLVKENAPPALVRGPLLGEGLPPRLAPTGPYSAANDAVEVLFVTADSW
jgi:hypothetical protein